MQLKKLNQKGDTILEVLISVAVLSLILATSFTLANRSTQTTRQAAERGEATKVAQSEIEKLKYYLSQPALTDEPDPGQFFCIDSSTTNMSLIDLNGAVANLTAVDNPAVFNSINANCRWGTSDRYAVIVQRGSTNPNTYTAYVRWDAVTGRTVEKISVIHRIHPDLIASSSLGTAGNSTILPDPSTSPPPPPPPPPISFNQTVNGWPINCTSPIFDIYDGCKQNGTSMYAYRNISGNYNFTSVRGPVTARIVFNFSQTPVHPFPPTVNIPPITTPAYNFIVEYSFNGQPYVAANLQPNPTNSFTAVNSPAFNIDIPATTSGGTLAIRWVNNASGTASEDANIQINSIRIYTP